MNGDITKAHITVLNVSLVLNILLMIGIIFGGLNWVTTISSEVNLLKEKTAELKDEIVKLRGVVDDIKKRHIEEDARREGSKTNRGG